MAVSNEEFRRAAAMFASAVTIITTVAEDGSPRGITATSVCPLSLNPPLMIVCVDDSAGSYPAFRVCQHFLINVLNHEHRDLATLFSTRGAGKFDDPALNRGAFELPAVTDAVARVACSVQERHHAGDHIILIGQVEEVDGQGGEPLVHFARGYHRVWPVEKPVPPSTAAHARYRWAQRGG